MFRQMSGLYSMFGKRAFSSSRVQIEVSDSIAVVRLTRPEKMNALDMDMFRAVRDAALALRENADVRCVVSTARAARSARGSTSSPS